MLISEVYNLLREFIESILEMPSLTVVYANQPTAPRATKPFITMSIGKLSDMSLAMKYDIDDAGQQNVLLNKSFIVTLESYADQLHLAEEVLNKIQNYLYTEQAYSIFKGDIAYSKTVLGVSAIPAAISGINESRAILELEFYLTQSVTSNVGLIEHIFITDLTNGDEIIINK